MLKVLWGCSLKNAFNSLQFVECLKFSKIKTLNKKHVKNIWFKPSIFWTCFENCIFRVIILLHPNAVKFVFHPIQLVLPTDCSNTGPCVAIAIVPQLLQLSRRFRHSVILFSNRLQTIYKCRDVGSRVLLLYDAVTVRA